MKKNVRLIKNILLVISFMPYIYIIGAGVYSAIAGYDVYTKILPVYVRTLYGLAALREVMFINALYLTVIPVLPVCLIYQLICLVIKIVEVCKKKKEKANNLTQNK